MLKSFFTLSSRLSRLPGVRGEAPPLKSIHRLLIIRCRLALLLGSVNAFFFGDCNRLPRQPVEGLLRQPDRLELSSDPKGQ